MRYKPHWSYVGSRCYHAKSLDFTVFTEFLIIYYYIMAQVVFFTPTIQLWINSPPLNVNMAQIYVIIISLQCSDYIINSYSVTVYEFPPVSIYQMYSTQLKYKMFLFIFSFRQSLNFYFKKYLAADHPKIGFSSNQRGLFNVNHLTWPLPINGRFSASSICCKIDQEHIFSCRIFDIHRTIDLKGNGIQNINNFLLTQTISSTIKQLPTASEFLPMPYKGLTSR